MAKKEMIYENYFHNNKDENLVIEGITFPSNSYIKFVSTDPLFLKVYFAGEMRYMSDNEPDWEQCKEKAVTVEA